MNDFDILKSEYDKRCLRLAVFEKALEEIDRMGDLTDGEFRKAGGTHKIFQITSKALHLR